MTLSEPVVPALVPSAPDLTEDDTPIHEAVAPDGQSLIRYQTLHPSLSPQAVADALALYGVWSCVDAVISDLRRDPDVPAEFVGGAIWLRNKIVEHIGPGPDGTSDVLPSDASSEVQQ